MRHGCRIDAPHEITIEAGRSRPLIDLPELWRFRDLLILLAWRDIRVRYRQTLLGIGWALAEPLVSTVLFTLLFNRLAGIDSGHTPYALHCAAGLLLWSYFGRALRGTTTSLVANASVATKAYFPRLILPLAAQAAALVDFGCALVAFGALCAWFGVCPPGAIAALPIFVLLTALTAMGVGLMLAAINVRYRDVSQALPLMTQLWMFATPVVYPLSLIPHAWRWVYGLNPMVGIIDVGRATLIPGASYDLTMLAPTLAGGLAMLWIGLVAFRSVEQRFADVV